MSVGYQDWFLTDAEKYSRENHCLAAWSANRNSEPSPQPGTTNCAGEEGSRGAPRESYRFWLPARLRGRRGGIADTADLQKPPRQAAIPWAGGAQNWHLARQRTMR